MRRDFVRVYVCVAIVCIWILTGCSAGHGEESALSEVEGISEDASGSGAEEEVPEGDAPRGDAGERIYVHVCGQVLCPGVYELPEGSRLCEAIEAAGGMTETAADTYLNQAEILADGQQVYVPTGDEVSVSAETLPIQETGDDKININTASREELMALTGIGEAKAAAIIRYREEKGSFQSTEELKEVEGIKDGVYNKVKDQIKV